MSLLDASQSNPLQGGPSFTLANRLLRLAWSVTWGLLGRWSPVPLHGWRRFLLRCFGARIHDTAKVYPRAKIWYPPNLSMDAHACLAQDVNCYCMDRIELGKYALVSQGAHLCAGSHDIDSVEFKLFTKPISIGQHAWVAAEAFVGPGVTIGDYAVLGARAVTFKDLAPMTVFVGNPAHEFRMRKVSVTQR